MLAQVPFLTTYFSFLHDSVARTLRTGNSLPLKARKLPKGPVLRWRDRHLQQNWAKPKVASACCSSNDSIPSRIPRMGEKTRTQNRGRKLRAQRCRGFRRRSSLVEDTRSRRCLWGFPWLQTGPQITKPILEVRSVLAHWTEDIFVWSLFRLLAELERLAPKQKWMKQKQWTFFQCTSSSFPVSPVPAFVMSLTWRGNLEPRAVGRRWQRAGETLGSTLATRLLAWLSAGVGHNMSTCIRLSGGGPGGVSHIKMTGVLVVPVRG